MIKPADELRTVSRNKRVIKTEIREIVKAMEHQMVGANRDGRTSIDFKVPKTYMSVGEDIDSIILIVSGVLKELVDGDYDVKILDLNHSYLFTIRWESELTTIDRRGILKFLGKHMVCEDDKK
jgi:hypothetical protein